MEGGTEDEKDVKRRIKERKTGHSRSNDTDKYKSEKEKEAMLKHYCYNYLKDDARMKMAFHI